MRLLQILLLSLIGLSPGCQIRRAALQGTIPSSQAVGFGDERIERIGEVVRQTMRREGIPGISIAVIDRGQLAFAQGFGWRDVSRKWPVDPGTQFQAGSISKPVTATGVLLLANAGKVDLDQDVNSYVKDWQLHSKFSNAPVTLRQLLCHRAGMTPHGFLGFRETREAPSLAECLSKHYFLNGPIKVKYPPGSRYKYSGGGYCVVQKVVEDVTEKPFETAMDQWLLQPLGMARSHFRQPPVETANIARGYARGWGVVLPGRWRVFPQKAAAGLWSTPQDLARLILALQTAMAGEAKGPIPQDLARAALTAQFDDWQGIGFRLEGEAEDRAFYHYGENVGYFAGFGAGVSNGRGWVIMSNGQRQGFDPIIKAIAREFGWN